MRECSDRFIQHDALMLKDFLELCRCFTPLMRGNVGFSSHIYGIQVRPIVKAKRRQTKFIRSSGPEGLKRLLRVSVQERKLRAKSWKVIELHDCVFGVLPSHVVGQGLCSV